MILSDDQMAAVNFGLKTDAGFDWVELPVGPQPVPIWAKGLRVDWMEGYANSPDVRLKASTDLRTWDNKWFERSGSRFMARHPDGRAEIYYHDGPVTKTTLRRWRRKDSTIVPSVSEQTVREGGDWEEYEGWATTCQSGFGGAHIPVLIGGKDVLRGQTVVLRGPWHGGSPSGYVEVAYVDMSSETTRRYMAADNRPWHARTASGGLYITESLFLRLLARFAPECRCARVTLHGLNRIEPVRGDWDKPKHWMGLDRWRAA